MSLNSEQTNIIDRLRRKRSEDIEQGLPREGNFYLSVTDARELIYEMSQMPCSDIDFYKFIKMTDKQLADHLENHCLMLFGRRVFIAVGLEF